MTQAAVWAAGLPAASDPAFERFARLVRRQLGVPVSLVTLVSADEQVFPGALGLPEPWQSTRSTPLTHSFCRHVVRSGQPLVVRDARLDPRVHDNPAIGDLHVVAYAGVPLVDVDDRVVGSLCAIDDRPRTWTADDLAVLTDLAGACSSELQLRRMRARAAEAATLAAQEWRRSQDLLEERRGVAETLQRAMLTELPRPDRLEIAARYLPSHAADRVGGDWYDAFTLPQGATVLAIGDVTGHDTAAAAAMGQLRTLLRGFAFDRAEAPSETMRRLDRAVRGLRVDTLATVVLARIEPDDDAAGDGSRLLRWTNAGHPPPVLLLADGSTRLLATRPELLVGVAPDRARTDHQHVLPPGSTLLLYSDGLIERRRRGRDDDGDLDAGTAALRRTLTDRHDAPLDELLDAVLAELQDDRDDDIAVLAVRTRTAG